MTPHSSAAPEPAATTSAAVPEPVATTSAAASGSAATTSAAVPEPVTTTSAAASAPVTTASASPAWETPSGRATWDDPLLQCLVILTRHWHRPASEEALRTGLPLVDNRLTPELFMRAATRAGLAARTMRKSLERISPLTMPVVLLLKERQACILTKRDDVTKMAHVIQPDSGTGTAEISLAELKQHYVGHAIFVRPAFQFDSRAEEHTDPPPKTWFWGTLRRYWPIYGEVIIASLLINLFTLASPLFVMNVYDRVVPNNAMETLWVLAIGVTSVYLFDFILRSLRGYFLDMAGKKADMLMASMLFEHVIGLRMVAQPGSTGALAKHLHEFESLRDFFTSATLTAFMDLPFLVLFLWMVAFLGKSAAWFPLMTVPVVLLVGILLQFPLGREVKKSFKESSQKHAVLVETLNGLEAIQTLGATGVMQRKWEQCVAMTADSGLKSRFISSLAVNFAALATNLATVAVVVHGSYLIAAGELTTGALVACSILTGRALAPLSQIAGILVRLQQSLVSLKMLNRIMTLPVERPPGVRFLHRPQLSGGITFQEVLFQYPGLSAPVLRQVSFHIRAGERVGFIGRIGSGKSTIFKLILGLLQPQEGAILADGADIRQIDPADLRRSIGCVPQEPLLFFGTARDNITLGHPFADDLDVLRAATLAGADVFIGRHPQGFDLPIGEGGRGLSGGQRQSLAIARALVADPPLLLLDEPTSAMDSGAEERFKHNLSAILPGKTLLLVTHKASLLTLVERLILVEDGRILADGPRDVVLRQLAEGRFRQAGG
ncbi:MAG: type I secretion system permease/ATPase [Magnetococcales bacterium]|nr:type I secretion system permease/ATPase [Magnetococcales bacterium]